jgi:hypothetical protein
MTKTKTSTPPVATPPDFRLPGALFRPARINRMRDFSQEATAKAVRIQPELLAAYEQGKCQLAPEIAARLEAYIAR